MKLTHSIYTSSDDDKLIQEEFNKSFYSRREAKRIKKFKPTTPLKSQEENYGFFGNFSQKNAIVPERGMIFKNRSLLITYWRNLILENPKVRSASEEIFNEVLVYSEGNPVKLNLSDIELPQPRIDALYSAWDKCLSLIEFNTKGKLWFEGLYTDGLIAFECIYNENRIKNGIQEVQRIKPHFLYEGTDIKTKRKYYFINKSNQYDFCSLLNDENYTIQDLSNEKDTVIYQPEQIAYADTGKYSKDKTFPISWLAWVLKPANTLEMLERSLVLWRLTRAPEKLAFYIDVGRASNAKARAAVNKMMHEYSAKQRFDISTGRLVNEPNTIKLGDAYWFPINHEGKSTKVETIGATNYDINSIVDIEYFERQVLDAMDVPLSRVSGQGRVDSDFASGIEHGEIKFQKSIEDKQRQFGIFLLNLFKNEVLSRQLLTLNEWKYFKDKIVVTFKKNNDYALLKKLNTDLEKLNVADAFLNSELKIPVSYILGNIMGFTDTEQKNMKEEWIREQNENITTEHLIERKRMELELEREKLMRDLEKTDQNELDREE